MKHLNVSTRVLSSVVNDVNKNKFDFNHPFQRKAGQWNDLMMSNLIDSAIRLYPILPILVEEYDDGRFGVIDGKQRLTVITSFFNGEFALHRSSLPIKIDNVTYEIAGKRFCLKKSNIKKSEERKNQRKKTKFLG